MSKEEKDRFIVSLIGAVEKEILDKVKDMPEDWDGHELRQYISYRFTLAVLGGGMSGKRMRDYKNEVLVRNL